MAGIGVAAGPNDQLLLVSAHPAEIHHRRIRQRLGQRTAQFFQGGVEIHCLPFFGGEAVTDNPLLAAQGDQAVNIDVRPTENLGLGEAILKRNLVKRLSSFEFFEAVCDIFGRIDRIGVKSGFARRVIFSEQLPAIVRGRAV